MGIDQRDSGGTWLHRKLKRKLVRLARSISMGMVTPKIRFLMMTAAEKLICWKCRGAASRKFASDMREIIREYRPRIIIIIKPKKSGDVTARVCKI